MDKVLKNLLSMKIAIAFLFLFGIISGVATFIENDFGVEASWAMVYTTWWFELIQIVLALTIVNNIFKYKVYKLEKLPSFMFHIGFLVILLGSGITRYIGYEGSMHIREGESENRIISSDVFVNASAVVGKVVYTNKIKKIFSSSASNSFSFDLPLKDESAHIKYKDFIPNANYEVVEDVSGEPMIAMMVSSKGDTGRAVLKQGDVKVGRDYVFTFDKEIEKSDKPLIRFFTKDGKIYVESQKPIGWFKMVENTRGEYPANEAIEFVRGQLYTIGETNFAPKFIGMKGKEKLVPTHGQGSFSALIVDVSYKGETKEVGLVGRGRGTAGVEKRFNIAGVEFKMSWGSEVLSLPFALKLNDFQLDRYPGSRSPMSYASEVEVIDKTQGENMPYRIYMNHVLDYQGFRFFSIFL